MSNHSEILADTENHPEQRIQAVFQLLRERSDTALDTLIGSLQNDPNPIVRHECAYCIGEFSSSRGAEALIHAITHDDNRFVVHEAMLAISNLGYIRSESILRDRLHSDDPDIVDTAEIALQRLDMRIAGDYVTDGSILLDNNSSKEERIQAAFILLDDNSDHSVELLIRGLEKENSPIVKHEIVFALGETASEMASQKLIAELAIENNAFVIHEILLSLATLGHKSSEPHIERFVDHPDRNIVLSADIALRRIQD